jgi:hypothetical protein
MQFDNSVRGGDGTLIWSNRIVPRRRHLSIID